MSAAWPKALRNLEAAQLLLDQGFAEESTGRAYYAAFHAARAALLSLGVEAKTHHGVHTQVSSLLIRNGHLPAEASRWLRLLEAARYRADYDTERITPEEEAREVLDLARQFVAAVGRYLGGRPQNPSG